MCNFSNLLSVSDASAAEALFVAAYECTSDSHLSNSFIRLALLSVLESLQEMLCWQECLQTWDRERLVQPGALCAASLMEPIIAGTSGTCWPEGELGGIQLCPVLCLHLRHCLEPSVVSGGAVRTVSRV